MTKAYIKICGVKDIKIAKHAIDCGASFLGFVFFKNSSRNISISKCKEILDEINDKVNTVAVTVNPTLSDLKTYSNFSNFLKRKGIIKKITKVETFAKP